VDRGQGARPVVRAAVAAAHADPTATGKPGGAEAWVGPHRPAPCPRMGWEAVRRVWRSVRPVASAAPHPQAAVAAACFVKCRPCLAHEAPACRVCRPFSQPRVPDARGVLPVAQFASDRFARHLSNVTANSSRRCTRRSRRHTRIANTRTLLRTDRGSRLRSSAPDRRRTARLRTPGLRSWTRR